MTYRTFICEYCFEINDCKTGANRLLLEDGAVELSLEWICPACRRYHRLPVEGDLDEAVEAYNKHISAVRDGTKEGLHLQNIRSEKDREKEREEEKLYRERRKKAEERDAQEGTNIYATRVYFGYFFRRSRLKRGIKLTQAAKEIGIRRETLHRIEMGEAGYSQETVLAMGRFMGITSQKACEMAGLEAPKETRKKLDATELLEETRRDFNETLDIEDDKMFLSYAIILRRKYQALKQGSFRVRALEVPAQPDAILAAHQTITELKKLEDAKRIITFFAIARTELNEKQRYQWIFDLALHVLNSEQRAELIQKLIESNEKKKN